MPEEFRTVERYGYTFIFPTKPPIGHRFDPTDVVSGQQGQIIVPIWRPEDKDFTIFRLNYLTVPTLPAAIRQGDHIIARCSQELKGVTDAVSQIQSAMAIYLNFDREVYLEESHQHIQQLLRIAGWFEQARRPEKKQVFSQLAEVIKKRGRDRAGRYNPQVMASHLFQAIYQLSSRRLPSLQRIVVEVAGRKAVLELTRSENQQIIETLLNELRKLLELALFTTRSRPAHIWYNRVITEIEQIAIPTKRLWGAPYLQLAIEIRNALSEVNDLLGKRYQLKAAKRIRQLLGEVAECPRSLAGLRRIAVALRRSRDWRYQKFATVARQLERLQERIEQLPVVLDLITRALRETVLELQELVKTGNWTKATDELDRLIARCEW